MFAGFVDDLVAAASAKSLGEWVKLARLNMGLHQDVLALLLGVHKRTVSKWERNVLTPSDLQVDLIHTFWRAKLRGWRDGHGYRREFEVMILTALGMRRGFDGELVTNDAPSQPYRLPNATPSGSSLVAVLKLLLNAAGE